MDHSGCDSKRTRLLEAISIERLVLAAGTTMSRVRRTILAEVREIISERGIQCPPERIRFPQPELKELFEGLFACPICRHRPLKLFEARFDPDVPDVLFIAFCKRCDAEVQYDIMRDTIEQVKEDLLKARTFATASDSRYKAIVPRGHRSRQCLFRSSMERRP